MSQSPPALSGPGPRQDAQDIATRTAESVAHAWHCQHLGERSQVPLGIVATLAQVRHPHSATDPAEHLRGLTTETLWRTLEGVWRRQWLLRPELVHWARALHSWLQEETLSRELGDAVQAVTYAALDAGLLSLTGAPDPMRRSAADVLAPLLGLLRSGARGRAWASTTLPGTWPRCSPRSWCRSRRSGEPGSTIRLPEPAGFCARGRSSCGIRATPRITTAGSRRRSTLWRRPVARPTCWCGIWGRRRWCTAATP